MVQITWLTVTFRACNMRERPNCYVEHNGNTFGLKAEFHRHTKRIKRII